MQKLMGRQKDVTVLLAQFLNELFIERKNTPEEKTEEREALKKKAHKICDIISLLGDAAKDSLVQRREQLQYAVSDPIVRKEMMKAPLTNEGVPNTFLFGDNLAEVMKKSDDSRKIQTKFSRGKENSTSVRPKHQSKNSSRYGKSSKYKKNTETYGEYKRKNSQKEEDSYHKKKNQEEPQYKSPLVPRGKRDRPRDH
jgi:hypothetical protein